jgi:NADPH:quinone reductase-like Zn-dependent oxidoreductase
MKAVVQETYGSAGVLQLSDVEKPAIGSDDVLVRVRAAGVDRGVWHLMAGIPYLVRFMGFGLRKPKIRVPGMDLSGLVETAGSNVTRFQRGDEVFGVGIGTFAEYACARQDKIELKPSNLTFEEAAAVPVSGLAALQAVRDEGRVQPGQRVLIIGASGGVGTFAVQIAKAFEAEVTGVCSTAKADLVKSIGADHVIDYNREDIVDGQRQYDVILDIGGNRSLSHLRRVLTPKGTLVIVGGEGGGRWFGLGRQLRAVLFSPFLHQKLRPQFPATRTGDLQFLNGLIEAGRVRPVIDRTFSMNQVPEAIHYLEEGRARGKVVITV